MIGQIILIVSLLLLSGFFSSSETAFTSLSTLQIETLADKKGSRGKLVKKLLKNPEKLLTAILTGNNLVNISLSVISTRFTIELLGNAFIGFMTGFLTLAILIFGEVIPKNLALLHNEGISVFAAPIINTFLIIFSPIIWFITLISSSITRYLSPQTRDPLTMDAILRLVRYAEAKGVLEDYERDMVHAVFRLDQQNISSIMTHRTEVFSLDKSSRIIDVIDLINSNSFSRIPVYEDNPENIKGIVLVKDIVKKIGCREENVFIKLEDIMIPPYFLPDNKKIRDALFIMQKAKKNMAIILDEYSGLAGIVTIEDIIEEIVGELYDEDDTPEHDKITILNENTYLVSGSALISMVNDSLGTSLPIGRFSQTIGGFIIDELGRIPKRKEKIFVKGAEIVVDSVSLTKINNVKIMLLGK
ncbi:MAG: hemolysin family protein [Spirochaetia bacterium]|jgi:CBS domain containing-hemolysin-like protein|nr:hemolysin family protein [Spirochaetia bacterium]